MPAEVKLYDIDSDGKLEVLGTAYDTSLSKTYPQVRARCLSGSACARATAIVLKVMDALPVRVS